MKLPMPIYFLIYFLFITDASKQYNTGTSKIIVKYFSGIGTNPI